MRTTREPDAFGRVATSCVEAVRRAAWPVVIVALVVTVAAGYYAARNLTVDTSTERMISEELPFRQRFAEFREAFPQFRNSFVVVVEGDTPDRAEEAAEALAARMRADESRFKTVYAPEIEPFFVRNGLLYLDREELADLTDRLADAQPLITELAQDPSLRGLFEVFDLALEDVMEGGAVPEGLDDVLVRVGEVVDSVAAGAPRPLSWSDVLRGETSEPGERRRFIRVQPLIDFSSLQPAAEGMEAVREMARSLGLVPENGVKVMLTGGAAIATEELQSVSSGAGRAGLLSLALVAVLLFVGLRSVRLMVAVLLTLVAGLIWTAAFTTLAIGHLNLMSVAFAVLFIGLGVDFGIHFTLRYLEEAGHGNPHAAALRRATAGVADALGLCTVAAAVGFYSFVPTAYTGLSELGIIAGTGMFIALFASLSLLPALMTLMPPGRSAAPRSVGPRALKAPQTANSLMLRHGARISVGAALLGIGAAVLVPMARFDADPIALKDPSTESVRVFRELMAESERSPYAIEVVSPDLATARRLAERLEALSEVDRAVTAASFVPSRQEEKLSIIADAAVFLTPLLVGQTVAAETGDEPRRTAAADMRARLKSFLASGAGPELREPARRLAAGLARIGEDARALATLEKSLLMFLPSRLDRLRQALEARKVSLADLPDSVRDRYLAPDGQARIQVFATANLSDPAAMERFVAAVYRVAPGATAAPVEIVESGKAVVGAVRQAAISALIIIAVLLFALLRSVRDTLLVLAPLTLAALFTVAVSVLVGPTFNFANVIVLPLLAGLGVASGIHLVLRAREERRDLALSHTSTPRAVIFSALTTVGSFGTLSISSHRGLSSMGELLTVAIAFTLFCALVFLPALMVWIKPKSLPASAAERGRLKGVAQ